MPSTMMAGRPAVPSVIKTSTIVVSVIFPVLSLFSILLRYKARRVGRQTLRADDWGIIATWIVTFAISIDVWVFAGLIGINQLGGGSGGKNLSRAVKTETQGLWISSILLQLCLTSVKISILSFYRRIFTTPTFRKTADGAAAMIGVWGTIYLFLIIFQEDPVSGAWTGKGRPVVNAYGLGLSRAITSMILDIVVLCFPLPVISRLHMRLKRKIAVMMIFWLGAFIVVAAALRLYYVVVADRAVANSKSNGGYSAVDLNARSLLFVMIEPNCSIIAACLPCYGPIFEGRKLESMVNSVRSTLSLGSRRSGSSGSRKSSKNHDQSDSNDGDSQIKLRDASNDWISWQSPAKHTAQAESVKQMNGNPESGIEVVRTYETSNDTLK